MTGKVKEIEKVWLSRKEVMAYLDISRATLDRLQSGDDKDSRLQFYRIRNHVLFLKTDIDNLIIKNRVVQYVQMGKTL